MFAPSKIYKKINPAASLTPFFNKNKGDSFFGKSNLAVDLSKPPQAGEIRPILSIKARIMASPRFLGVSVISVRRGARVKVLKVAASWCFVEYRMRQGWVHKNRIMKKKIRLSSGDTGSGTSRGEMELGGRG